MACVRFFLVGVVALMAFCVLGRWEWMAGAVELINVRDRKEVETFIKGHPLFVQRVSDHKLLKAVRNRDVSEAETCVVTVCANCTQLEQVIRSALNLSDVRDVIVLDIDPTDMGYNAQLVEQEDQTGRVIYIAADQCTYGSALNFAVRLALCRKLLLLEGDVTVSRDFVKEHKLKSSSFYRGSNVLYVARREWASGVDERFEGGEVDDLVQRLKNRGIRKLAVVNEMVSSNPMGTSKGLQWYVAHFARKKLGVWNGGEREWDVHMLGSSTRLWIRSIGKGDVKTMWDSSSGSVTDVLLRAHEALLSREYGIPGCVLKEVERASVGKEVHNYGEFVKQVVERKKHAVVVEVVVTEVLKLFVGLAWGIAYAVKSDRPMVLTGRLGEIDIGEVVDLEGIRDTLEREYGIKTEIWGGGRGVRCQELKEWRKVEVREGPWEVKYNEKRHMLMRIGKRVRKWDDVPKNVSEKALIRQVFACTGFASGMGLNVSRKIWENLEDVTTLWVRRGRREFVEKYLEHHWGREGARPLLFVTGDEEGVENVKQIVGAEGGNSIADMHVALLSRNVVFEGAVREAWVDEFVEEWRRIRGGSRGVVHVRGRRFCKVEFGGE